MRPVEAAWTTWQAAPPAAYPPNRERSACTLAT
jgi:hypothetical protein